MQFDLVDFPRKNWNLGNRDRVRIRRRVFDVLKIPMGKIRTSTWIEACSFFDDTRSYVVIFWPMKWRLDTILATLSSGNMGWALSSQVDTIDASQWTATTTCLF